MSLSCMAFVLMLGCLGLIFLWYILPLGSRYCASLEGITLHPGTAQNEQHPIAHVRLLDSRPTTEVVGGRKAGQWPEITAALCESRSDLKAHAQLQDQRWLAAAFSRHLDVTYSCPALASSSTPMGRWKPCEPTHLPTVLTPQVLQEVHSEKGDRMAGLNPV